jgi:hypothetical protein
VALPGAFVAVALVAGQLEVDDSADVAVLSLGVEDDFASAADVVEGDLDAGGDAAGGVGEWVKGVLLEDIIPWR